MNKEKHVDPNIVLPGIDLCCKRMKQTFPHLSTNELKSLFTLDSIRFYPKRALIYAEETRVKGCYFVYSGITKIYQTGHAGKVQIIKFAKEGDILGFSSIIQHKLACSSSETLSDSILCYIPENILLELLESNSGFAHDMVHIACKELGDANRYIREMAQKTVKERLAEVLILIADEFGIEVDGSLKLKITREDLSNYLGTATETVIRLLSEYKIKGLIESKERKIILLDIEKIKTIAGM